MAAEKRRTGGFVIVLILSVFILMSRKPVLAVAGQINNMFATPTQPPTAVIMATPDTTELNACNEKKSQIQEELNNCQKATALAAQLDRKDDAEEHFYLYWAIGSTILAVILGIILTGVSLKKKKTPPVAPVIPPFSA